MAHPTEAPRVFTDELQRFLDEEATPEALAHLLEKAQAARRNRLVEPYSGNAYQVSFDDEDVQILRYGVKRSLAVHLQLDDFIAALQAWKAWPGA